MKETLLKRCFLVLVSDCDNEETILYPEY